MKKKKILLHYLRLEMVGNDSNSSKKYYVLLKERDSDSIFRIEISHLVFLLIREQLVYQKCEISEQEKSFMETYQYHINRLKIYRESNFLHFSEKIIQNNAKTETDVKISLGRMVILSMTFKIDIAATEKALELFEYFTDRDIEKMTKEEVEVYLKKVSKERLMVLKVESLENEYYEIIPAINKELSLRT